jgi:tetratricopeptide (TPR) repeat protein
MSCALALALLSAQPATDSAALVKEGRKAEQAGHLTEAIAAYRRAVSADQTSFDARYALGRALDLAGDYPEARTHLDRAIELASDEARNQALAAMAVSYAFERKAEDAARYYQRSFDSQMAAKAFDGAAGTANALARVYLETGSLDKAEEWYRTGYETAKQIAQMPADQADLWQMRWEHALARLAARRGRTADARRHAAQVRALLDKGTNEDQRPSYPYLAGYIAFYAGDHAAAIDELLKGDLTDPFVAGLLAQTYEKQGDTTKAREFYEKVMVLNAHSLQAAFSRPHARQRLKVLRPLRPPSPPGGPLGGPRT